MENLTNSEIIRWLEVCCKGYVKPDSSPSPSSNSTGVVTDTKNVMPIIFSINKELAKRSDINDKELLEYLESSTKRSIIQNSK